MLKKFLPVLILIMLFFSGSTLAGAEPAEEQFSRGKVISVTVIDDEHTHLGIKQQLEVKLTGGPRRGESITVENYYFPGDPMFFRIEEGQEVIVVSREDDAGEQFYIQDLARDRGIYYLLGIFILLMLALGRLKGVKIIISLVVTVVLIFKFLLPLLLQGYNPVLLAIIVASAAIVFTLLLIGGINKKTLAAILGTTFGVIIAGLMALWAGNISHLTGLGTEEAQMLYYLDHTIDIRGLLFAGIIIGSLGAITDVGMSIASAAAEIKQVNPKIKFKELAGSAFNVGRDIMGTMANTLILAYVGAATPLLLVVMAYQIHWLKVINLDLIATEFVRGVAGSIGLIVAVPVTAAVAGFLMGQRDNKTG